MRLLRLRWFPVLAAVLLVGGPVAWFARRPAAAAATGSGAAPLVAEVKKGDFRVVVTTTGELRSRKFVQIQGPMNAQQAEVWQMRIASIVPEGTVVKTGDVVAELDRAPVATKAAEFALAMQKADAVYTQAQLDSALSLSQAREDIRNMEFGLEEKRIAKEQSRFEAPSIRRQADIDYEKAQRALEQAKANYITKSKQSVAKMSEVGADLERQRNRVNTVQSVIEAFTIRAPEPGMVIYVREWNGRKKGVGSQVSPWEPTVATLPDLSQMESVTYVNEIDVRRLASGQKVAISLDAEPSKRLTGTVVAVANVGEQRPNTDAKVFEVKITITEADTTLRPGMTTSNAIEAAVIPNALFVPIEAVSYEGTQAFVFKQDGGRVVRQQIETGTMNEDQIVVLRGVGEGEKVLLSPPADREGMTTVLLEGAPASDAPRTEPVPAVPPAAAPTPPAAAPAAPAAAPAASPRG